MRFDLQMSNKIDTYEQVLSVSLYIDSEEKVFNCSCTVSEDRLAFLAMVEMCVNGCLQSYIESNKE